MKESDITRYTCYHTNEPFEIDGRLDKDVWQMAPKSARFVDMADGSPGYYDTRCAALWSDSYLYVGFWVEEPFILAEYKERDSIIFRENDVELFIDGGDCYYELELNAIGTIYEVLFIWRDAYRRGSRFDTAEFDILEKQPYTFGGDYDRTPASFWKGTHPRGTRWAYPDWDLPGLEVKTAIDGTINDNSDIDNGWTAEIAIPWEGLGVLAGDRPIPPTDSDIWRMFFGRFQKLSNAGEELNPHPAWVMSSHGIYDTHQPERFPFVSFSKRDVSSLA
jgi:hypothetical protein